jgi:hypothetical protein
MSADQIPASLLAENTQPISCSADATGCDAKDAPRMARHGTSVSPWSPVRGAWSDRVLDRRCGESARQTDQVVNPQRHEHQS